MDAYLEGGVREREGRSVWNYYECVLLPMRYVQARLVRLYAVKQREYFIFIEGSNNGDLLKSNVIEGSSAK